MEDTEEQKIKDSLPKSRLSEFSNKVFENVSPVGATHVLTGIWAKIFVLFMFTMLILTFSLTLWYFLAVECTQNNVMVSAFPDAQNFVDKFLDQSSIKLCDSAAQTRASFTTGAVQSNNWYCCSLSKPRTHANPDICDSFKKLYNDCSDVGVSCWDQQFGGGLIQVSYAECTSPGTALVNSIQYAQYIATVVCLGYLAVRVALKHGVNGLLNWDNWKTIFNNVREVERMKSQSHGQSIEIHSILQTGSSPLDRA